MSPTTILERARSRFTSEPDAHFDSVRQALMKGTPKEPVRPMSDQELARATREFHAPPVTALTLAKLSRRFVKAERNG